MRLNTQSDYALRLLMHLAVNEGERMTIDQTAETFDISKNHLMKVTQLLVQHGYVASMRGRNGGLSLARKAADISVGDVVRDMENDFALVECFEGRENSCILSQTCRLKRLLVEANEQFLKVLDTHTIGDLVRRNQKLVKLLRVEVG